MEILNVLEVAVSTTAEGKTVNSGIVYLDFCYLGGSGCTGRLEVPAQTVVKQSADRWRDTQQLLKAEDIGTPQYARHLGEIE